MLLHAKIPNRIGGLGSLVETFLPWFGLFIPVLLAGALWRRSASAVVALLLPVTAWLNLFGGLLVDRSQAGSDLTVVSHNVGAENPDPAGTARDLAASGADLLALEEITSQAKGTYEKELAQAYPHHTVQGTVGLWSKLPLSDTRPVDTQQDAGPRPPGHHSAGHCLRPQAQRVETEVIFQFVPQELTDLGPAGAGTEPLEERGEHAVVLVLHIVSDAHRIPLIEQTPQAVLGGGVPGSHRPRLPPRTITITHLLIQAKPPGGGERTWPPGHAGAGAVTAVIGERKDRRSRFFVARFPGADTCPVRKYDSMQ